jgi:mannose-1-phosphate guanylyltransferase
LSIYLRRDRNARVLVLPSDHYVAHEKTLRRVLMRAALIPPGEEGRLVLLGMTPSEFDPEYGWVLPDPSHPDGRVSGFVEKPGREAGAELMALGALVSTFMFVAEASALLHLYAETLRGSFAPSLIDRAVTARLVRISTRRFATQTSPETSSSEPWAVCPFCACRIAGGATSGPPREFGGSWNGSRRSDMA